MFFEWNGLRSPRWHVKELAKQCGCGLGQVCAVPERLRLWFYDRQRVTTGRAPRRPELAGLVREIFQGR